MAYPPTLCFSTSGFYVAACWFTCAIWAAVGLYKLSHYERTITGIRAHHIPLPVLAFWVSVFAELVGVVLVVTQKYLWIGVIIWILFLIIATPIYHGHIFQNGVIDYAQFVHVSKNISIAGGLVALMLLSGERPTTVHLNLQWMDFSQHSLCTSH